MNMTSHISLRIFLVCMIACAAMVLGVIWLHGRIEAPLYFQTTATLFVVGFASSLIWFSSTLMAIRASSAEAFGATARRPEQNGIPG